MYDNSILPTEIAVSLGLICNIGAPLLAFWAAARLPRLRLWFHGVAFVVILASPLVAMMLGLPELLPEEEESAEARFAFLPLVVETTIIALLYCLAGAMFLSRSVHSTVADWHGGSRFLRVAARSREKGYVSKMPRP